ncbi:lysophospholipid acyltransferase family protein [Castellaniella sp. GW247-6E4]|uniref:lysophospholipid acyltransferase family protein n=1 Tax=Castellaniella sp. GW247-6E4 TaxID=3140380 RepID=UPI0033163858
MAPILFFLRALMTVCWIAAGLLAELLAFPLLGLRGRQALIQGWSRILLRLCGVRMRRHGRPVLDGPVLWVANHVSWLDIFVIDAVRPTSFIAKSDIRRWPVIGLLVAWAGTLFIDRRQRHAVREAGRQMLGCFERGDAVGLFPEGTTTEGLDVRPFHAGLFEAAAQADVPVQPIALRFLQHGQRTVRFAFVGEQTLVGNLWTLLGARGVEVEAEFLPPLAAGAEGGRAELARRAHQAIAQAVRPRG